MQTILHSRNADCISGAGANAPLENRWWGKAGFDNSWHPLAAHSLDVAATGIVLLRRLPTLHRWIAQRLALTSLQAETWVGFWLSIHDLGKFSEAFQSQRPDLFLQLRGRPPNPAKPYTVRHDTLGMVFWSDVLRPLLVAEAWFGPRSEDLAEGLDCWMRASTGHHGQPPQAGGHWRTHFDAHEDRVAALAHVTTVRGMFLTEDLVAAILAQDVRTFLSAGQELSWWMAGLAVLADWLGSNTSFFAYLDTAAATSSSLDGYWHLACRKAEIAVAASGVVAQPQTKAATFSILFPELRTPSPLQRWASSTSLPDGPQIHFLEDVTGAGKTEAALMLTHRLMNCALANGFFVALPTMATANAMYARIAGAYQRLFDGPASLALATSSRRLVAAFTSTVVEDLGSTVLPADCAENDPSQQDETASARCSAWLADHHKRALLAPAGVGTIDQALLAVLHSKHQSLRLLGMMGKVLVVDEVHACDDYMLKVLGVLLEFHSRGGGSAVLLSATLPLHAKQRLLTAFARGLAQPAPHMSSAAYPLATTWPAPSCPDRTEEVAIATRDDVRRTVEVSLHEQLADVLMIIRAALSEGRCICWVRNTVADAIEAHSLLQGEVPAGQVWLFHARFVLHDRLTMEDQVLQAFGKRSGRAERTGRLLIATQVVEQSLDVDFDVLVSDLAPIDRLVQRAGRLQRHRRRFDGTPESDPAAGDARGVPLLHLLCPPWTDTPAANWYRKAFPRAAAVYPNHAQLWLTMKLLRNGVFTMPDDARRLIESVFGEDAESPSGLQANAEASAGQRMAAQSQAMMNTLRLQDGYSRNQSGGVDWWSDASTPSRLGEATSNVTLARWDGERLRPWVDRPHGWIYSSLRMATCAIADTAPADNAMLQAAIDDVQKELPAHGRWTVLLPLRETAHGWTGAAMAGGSPASRRAWRYDPQRGLESWRTEDGQTDNRMEASDT